MTGLILDLPHGGGETFDWMLARMRSGEPAFANDIVSFRVGDADRFGLSLGDEALASVALAVSSLEGVEIAPGVTVQAVETAQLTGFLSDQWRAFNHLGINLSHLELGEAEWHRLIAAVAAKLPAWRLKISSANDIVVLVAEDGDRASVVELVYDRAAPRTSFHVCARVAADRAAVEAAFPPPFGAYKPGDEPFFRSVALPISPRLPSYLDLAFSDAQMGPWPQIVAAMGKRIA